MVKSLVKSKLNWKNDTTMINNSSNNDNNKKRDELKSKIDLLEKKIENSDAINKNQKLKFNNINNKLDNLEYMLKKTHDKPAQQPKYQNKPTQQPKYQNKKEHFTITLADNYGEAKEEITGHINVLEESLKETNTKVNSLNHMLGTINTQLNKHVGLSAGTSKPPLLRQAHLVYQLGGTGDGMYKVTDVSGDDNRSLDGNLHTHPYNYNDDQGVGQTFNFLSKPEVEVSGKMTYSPLYFRVCRKRNAENTDMVDIPLDDRDEFKKVLVPGTLDQDYPEYLKKGKAPELSKRDQYAIKELNTNTKHRFSNAWNRVKQLFHQPATGQIKVRVGIFVKTEGNKVVLTDHETGDKEKIVYDKIGISALNEGRTGIKTSVKKGHTLLYHKDESDLEESYKLKPVDHDVNPIYTDDVLSAVSSVLQAHKTDLDAMNALKDIADKIKKPNKLYRKKSAELTDKISTLNNQVNVVNLFKKLYQYAVTMNNFKSANTIDTGEAAAVARVVAYHTPNKDQETDNLQRSSFKLNQIVDLPVLNRNVNNVLNPTMKEHQENLPHLVSNTGHKGHLVQDTDPTNTHTINRTMGNSRGVELYSESGRKLVKTGKDGKQDIEFAVRPFEHHGIFKEVCFHLQDDGQLVHTHTITATGNLKGGEQDEIIKSALDEISTTDTKAKLPHGVPLVRYLKSEEAATTLLDEEKDHFKLPPKMFLLNLVNRQDLGDTTDPISVEKRMDMIEHKNIPANEGHNTKDGIIVEPAKVKAKNTGPIQTATSQSSSERSWGRFAFLILVAIWAVYAVLNIQYVNKFHSELENIPMHYFTAVIAAPMYYILTHGFPKLVIDKVDKVQKTAKGASDPGDIFNF
uniref:Uncharacterized protein n=1 Tax=Megaviridae environmental sample TaxID=1737588 RepID=A0A5J6VLL9_9VIRU|nr:MAG: hypothetical protein [Megaviridae environmental sample]